ncbi:MAG: division/cell wall cluster transcriptional repressor MraZ [Jatrophihabitantaceae bacterium]
MFLGTYSPRLDDKGRLALPAKFRPDLDDGLVVCKGLDRCLFVFATPEFEKFTHAIRSAPITDKRVRNYGRTVFASGTKDSLDGQGRIPISPVLRKYAGLVKDCVVVGVDTRLEIWDSPTWEAYADEADSAFADIAEVVLPGFF